MLSIMNEYKQTFSRMSMSSRHRLFSHSTHRSISNWDAAFLTIMSGSVSMCCRCGTTILSIKSSSYMALLVDHSIRVTIYTVQYKNSKAINNETEYHKSNIFICCIKYILEINAKITMWIKFKYMTRHDSTTVCTILFNNQ